MNLILSRALGLSLLFLLVFTMGSHSQVMNYVTGTQIDSLVSRGQTLMWKIDCSGNSSRSILRQKRVSDGDEFSLVNVPCSTARFVGELALASSGRLYTLTSAGNVVRLSFGGRSTIATTPNPNRISQNSQLSASTNWVYWTEERGEFLDRAAIYRTERSNGPALLVADVGAADNTWVRDLLAVSDTSFFVLLANRELYYYRYVRRPIPTPPFVRFVWERDQISQRTTAMEIANERLYYITDSSDGRSLFFNSKPLSNPTGTAAFHGLDFRTQGHEAYEMAVADDGIYYQELVTSSTGPLKRKPFASGENPIALDTLDHRAKDMQRLEDHIYWIRNASTISRLAVGSDPVMRDLRTGTFEVVQAIQNQAHGAQLIAGKITHVRAFAHIVNSSVGETSIASEMVLYGSRVSGGSLPGSPLRAIRSTPVTAAAGDRRDNAQGFLFRLPESWVNGGLIRLTTEINATRAIPESSYANNRNSRVFDFIPKVPICMVIIPTVTHFGTIRRYDPVFQETFDYLEALLPTSRLQVDFSSADRLDESDGPFGLGDHSPFEFEDDVDDDGDKVLLGLYWKYVFGSGGAHCQPEGGFDHYVAMLPRHPNPGYSGYASVGTDALTMPSSLFFFRPGANRHGVPNPAATQAQELGHNYGRRHVDCGDPPNVDGNYPFDPCTLASPVSGYLGFNPFTRQVILPENATDFMSYGAGEWVSSYTWQQMFNRISNRGAPLDFVAKGGGSPESEMVVTGTLHPAEGEADLRAGQEMTAEQARLSMNHAADLSCSHEALAYGDGSEPVGTFPVWLLTHSFDQGSDHAINEVVDFETPKIKGSAPVISTQYLTPDPGTVIRTETKGTSVALFREADSLFCVDEESENQLLFSVRGENSPAPIAEPFRIQFEDHLDHALISLTVKSSPGRTARLRLFDEFDQVKVIHQVKLSGGVPSCDGSRTVASARLRARADDLDISYAIIDLSDPVIGSILAIDNLCLVNGDSSFFVNVSHNQPLTRVDIIEKGFPESPVASLTGGGQVPTVSIESPNGGDTFTTGQNLTVSWIANDDATKALSYMVRFTHDEGRTWQVLTEHYGDSSFTIPVDELPGSGARTCRVEVCASDGICTGRATSGTFTIPGHAPTVNLFFENDQERNSSPLAHATYACGEVVRLRGKAFDVEDGEIREGMSWEIAGPESRSLTGPEIMLTSLLPGDYSVTLRVKDIHNQEGSSVAQFMVLPKFIREASGEILLDGLCDPGYDSDEKVLEIRYPDRDLPAEVRMVHREGKLYLCASGLDFGGYQNEEFFVAFDLNNSGGTSLQSGDIAFSIRARDYVNSLTGSGLFFTRDSVPSGVTGALRIEGELWHAELCIEDSRLQGWNGQVVGMHVAHHARSGIVDHHRWPSGSVNNRPAGYADVAFGSNALDPRDSDNDGLPDVWEQSQFGNLSRNGAQDEDGDGSNNRDEFIAGTLPRDPSSVFRAMFSESGELSWPTAADRSYSIERSRDLIEYETFLSGIGTGSAIVPLPAEGEPKLFYRVIATAFGQ